MASRKRTPAPVKDTQINVRLSAEEMRCLSSLAQHHRQGASTVIRMLIAREWTDVQVSTPSRDPFRGAPAHRIERLLNVLEAIDNECDAQPRSDTTTRAAIAERLGKGVAFEVRALAGILNRLVEGGYVSRLARKSVDEPIRYAITAHGMKKLAIRTSRWE